MLRSCVVPRLFPQRPLLVLAYFVADAETNKVIAASTCGAPDPSGNAPARSVGATATQEYAWTEERAPKKKMKTRAKRPRALHCQFLM